MHSHSQKRLRKRFAAKTAQSDDKDAAESSKEKQWLEIQARARKISIAEFQSLAERGKEGFKATIHLLQTCPTTTPQEVIAALESLDGADQWFQGGLKEMKNTVVAFQKLERRIDAMHEYVNTTKSITCALEETDVRYGACGCPLEALKFSAWLTRHCVWWGATSCWQACPRAAV